MSLCLSFWHLPENHTGRGKALRGAQPGAVPREWNLRSANKPHPGLMGTGQLLPTSKPWWAGEGVLVRMHPLRAKIAPYAWIYAFNWAQMFSGNRLKLLVNWKQWGNFIFRSVPQSSVIQHSALSCYSSEAATSFYPAVTWPPWCPCEQHGVFSLHAMFPCRAC